MPKRLTVAMLVVVLAVGGTAVAQTAQRFSDVPPNHEAFEAVEWAAETGLTVGYGDGTFGPDDPLSRWQAVTFMERYYDDILQASESDRFTRGDMMMLLKAIDDGAATTTAPEPTPTSGRWLPRHEDKTASGRCTHTISDTDLYAWEECAWRGRPDPVQNRAAMQALATRVWNETLARGKPANPPTLVEGQCRGNHAAACYLPSTHTISIESGVTLRVILHEIAHALITGDAVMADCYADWTSVVPHCAHGALFRCAADALYQRYADIDQAGVCGTAPDTGDWTHHSSEGVSGRIDEWRTTVILERWRSGDVRDYVLIALRCESDTLSVYANGTNASFGYGYGRGGTGVIVYRLGDQSEPTRVVATEWENHWTDSGDLWGMSAADAGRFVDAMAADASGRLFLRLVEEHDSRGDRVEAEATLRTTGYRTHVQPFVDDCS